MKLIKGFTALKVVTKTIDDVVKVKLEYGKIEGAYYNRENPTEVFDTEKEAIKYAYDTCEYSRWLILPVIDFDCY